jgi:3-hydroxyacyl-[acyl-carrier-protein] dehydratase
MSVLVMDADKIKSFLPHREPFLFVDGVTKIEGKTIEAFRDIRPDEFYFAGHFPGYPVLPGVLMVEAIAQAGILVVLVTQEDRKERKTLFVGIESVRFRRQVKPGERLTIRAEIVSGRAGVYKVKGQASVGEELACEAVVTGALR